MIYPWGDSRRFNSYTAYFQRQFGGRVQKISLDAGFTCPNRDGTRGRGGCTFCVNEAFNPSYCQASKSIRRQLEEGKAFHAKRYRRATRYLAYFQAYSNTYADINSLRKMYAEALSVEGVVGLVIGTRPDVISDEVFEMLAELQQTHYIMLEFGIESVYDQSLNRVNRGHDFATARQAVERAKHYKIPVGAHFIFGLPGETRRMMLDAAAIIGALPLTSVKFHQLQIFKNTALATEYDQDPMILQLFDLETYTDFIIDFIEFFNPSIIIERFASEVPPTYLLSAPFGSMRYDAVLQKIEQKMAARNTYQGKYFC